MEILGVKEGQLAIQLGGLWGGIPGRDFTNSTIEMSQPRPHFDDDNVNNMSRLALQSLTTSSCGNVVDNWLV